MLKFCLALSVWLAASSASAVTFVSECPHELWVYYGYQYGGGSDGIGDSGSWSAQFSEGWYRIGPFKNLELGGNGMIFALIKTPKGNILTRLEDKQGEAKVKGFCTAKKGHKFAIRHRGRFDQQAGNYANDCSDQGGISVTFQPMFDDKSRPYGTFTIFGGSCDK